MHEVDVTDHAVSRYRERVRPGLSLEDCERELLHVLTFAVVVEDAPGWARPQDHRDIAMWALLGEDIAFPLQRAKNGGSRPPLVAVTCFTRLGCNEATLARRRELRQSRRRTRREFRRDASYARGRGRPVAA